MLKSIYTLYIKSHYHGVDFDVDIQNILMSTCSVDEKLLSSWDIRDENLALTGFDAGSDLVIFEPFKSS